MGQTVLEEQFGNHQHQFVSQYTGFDLIQHDPTTFSEEGLVLNRKILPVGRGQRLQEGPGSRA